MELKSGEYINPNPEVYEIETIVREEDEVYDSMAEDDSDDSYDAFDSLEVFDLIRNILDPEHPHTLEQLKVLQHELIHVDNENNHILVRFTPTITHCSMATLIGLSIRVKLLRSLPKRFKIDLEITPGTHQSEEAVNRQLNDKERVAAALENTKLLSVVNRCIANHH
jgi:metal-sulfur cluster biosynthetic enzyme